MPDWESLDDGVLVYGTGTNDERKLEGWREVCDYLNQLEANLSEYRQGRGALLRELAAVEKHRDALSQALSDETRVLRETTAEMDTVIDALMGAFGTTRYEYFREGKTVLDAVNTVLSERDDATKGLEALDAEFRTCTREYARLTDRHTEVLAERDRLDAELLRVTSGIHAFLGIVEEQFREGEKA